MKNILYSRDLRLWVAATTCVCLFTACGSGSAEPHARSGKGQITHKSVEACLLRGGAEVASSVRDLGFLSSAEAREEVSKSGLIFDRAAGIVVRLWTAATVEGRPPRWAVWFGQRLNSDQLPSEIVESHPPSSYVLFVNRPSPAVRHRVDACLGPPGFAEPAHLHSVR